MRKNKFVQRKQQSIKNTIIFFILLVGLGYALLQQDLNITGTTSIQDAKWDIHWNNVQVTDGSVTGDNVVTEPTIDSLRTTVTYAVVLAQPGDYYEFTVDAVNSGTINGMVESVSSKLNGVTITTLPEYLDYSVTYSDGTEIQENQLLNAGDTKTYKLKIKYRDDIELNQIPDSNQSLSLAFTVKYKQADISSPEETIITYNANGGTGTMENQTIPANSTETLSKNTFTREGYSFKNWNTKADGTGTAYTDEEEVSNLGEITLYAQWKVESFPYVFKQDGICTFNGASANITGEDCSKYTNGKYIDTGIKLYSETNKGKDYEIGFTIEEYVPENNTDQATLMNTKYESTGYPGVVFRKQDNTQFELASRKTSSANENYRFASAGVRDVKIWRINNEIYYKIDDGPKTFLNNLSQYNPTFDLNVWFGATPTNASATTAQRYFTGKLSNMYIRLGTYVENNSYTITFNPNGGEVDPEFIIVSEGDAVGTLPTPTKALHNFVGWYTGLTDGVEVTSTYEPSDDMELFARWQKKQVYTISFDTDGGSSVDDIEIEQGTAVGTLPVPTKANMSFDGWYLESTYNTKVTSSYIPTESITLHAKWSDSTFPKVFEQIGACTFNGSSGTITGENCGDYVGQKYIDTGIALYSETNKNKDYEIGFTINSYTPTDNESRATLMNTKLEATGYPGVVFRRNDATDNFVLQSRKTSSANEQKTFAYNTVTSVKVYRISNEIYYSINGGDKVLLNNLTEYNPTFNLTTWFGAAPSNEAGTAAQRYLKGTLSNMYIKLGEYEEEGKYRITYNVNGGEEVEPSYKDVIQGDSVGTLPTPTKELAIFDGWYTDLTGGIEIDENYTPTGNMIIFARWTDIPSYTITFNSNGGSSVPDRRIVQGTSIGTLPNTTKNMADFDGWYTGLADGIEVDENYIPSGNIILFARWTEMQHTLYNVLKNEANIGTYAMEYTDNHQDSMAGIGGEKIYHWYAGNVDVAETIQDKRNVIFGGFCWQTVRTTDTGGVKMIYNGVPNDGECNNTEKKDIRIGTSKFNPKYNNPVYVGYMYNPSAIDRDTIYDYSGATPYGDKVTYSDGYYTLMNTASSNGSKYHYTCMAGNTTCSTIRFYLTDSKFVVLSNGETIEDVFARWFTDGDVNATDSAVKTYIDDWYQNNMTNYTNKLEDTIFCNNRSIDFDSEGNMKAYLTFTGVNDNVDLSCENVTDRFSMSNAKAQLTYPIGLLTRDELSMLGRDLELFDTLTMTPRGYLPDYYEVGSYGITASVFTHSLRNNGVAVSNSVRPVISLKPNTEYISGNGSKNNPYIVQ